MGKAFIGVAITLSVLGATWAAAPAVAAQTAVAAPTPAADSTIVKLDNSDQTATITRKPPDFRLINDPPLVAREYGFGILGSLVAGTLGFYIGSGIETAITSESRAH